VVHGGPDLVEPALIDDATLGKLRGLIPLARCTNPTTSPASRRR